ncbi:VanW family protein [Polyangium sp. y55x31]|uniref:VanW family protein n=1 Tax=Polyangium sp. y55x31 TaxID=3042688 RepID=UPI0024829AE8|nr:VanW family protein [Polyangium sp. y55x31]MDI1476830.1 VanW family protein [Polyangium sp. y55x31]
MRAPRSSEVKRYAAMAAVAIASGLGITWLLLPPAPEAPVKLPTPELRVAGMAVPMQGDPVANALDLVRRYAAGEITIKLPDGTGRKIRRGALGAEIDRVRLAGFVREALREGSPLRRAHDEANPGKPLDVPLPLILDAEAAVDKLLALKSELDAAPTDAYVDLAQKKLVPEKDGHRLDVYGTIARIDAAFRQGADEVAAAVEKVPPKRRAEQMGNVKFDHVLGWFQTGYTKGERTKDRTYNLRLAASKLDGAVVMPGEVFDFNDVVGPRDEAHGYRVATVIAQGELVDGLGGGTCQISGTLHGAAFFAGLDIVERYPHSRPSSYIKLGLDATVVYPTINFRFRNPFDFPIVLHETVSDGIVRAEILGPERRHTVTYFRRIDEVLPFEEVERQTPKLPEGMRVLAQRGIPGFKTTSSRVVRDGAHALRYKWSDQYPPTAQIINVGTGPKELDVKAKDDEHPEYVVDEYLVLTQGPDIRTPGATEPEPAGGMIESREPGRTGERDPYEKLGLPHYRSKSAAEAAPEGEAPVTQPASAEPKDEGKGKKPEDDKGKKKKRKKKKPAAESGT